MAKKKTKTTKKRTSKKRVAKKTTTTVSSTRKKSKKKKSSRAKGKKADPKITALREFIRTKGPEYLEDPNITSLGIGYKVVKGKRTKTLCVQFTVKSKPEETGAMPESISTSLIPETLTIGGNQIATDILQREYRPSFELLDADTIVEQVSERKRRQDPVFPGISVSHPLGTAGTLGMVVYDDANGTPYMLSNWHVLHTARGAIGDSIVQPGPFDDNDIDENFAGELVRSHLGAAGDCAIATISGRGFDTNIFQLDVTPTRLAKVELDDKVIKSGRTTDVTVGVVRRIEVLASISYSGMGNVAIGAFEIEPKSDASNSFEISMGGDSGSVWMIADANDAPTDILVGLHFAGESGSNPDEHALACYAHSVMKKLDISLEQNVEPDSIAPTGYQESFLSESAPLPSLSRSASRDSFAFEGSPILKYTHFSVIQSKGRRLPRLVAWNIDGSDMKRISRRGIRFRLDPRVPSEFQAGNELYSNNRLDRGHVARRVDLNWGSIAEAKKANKDSFFFTNITPQHQNFNQSSRGGLWGELENAILDDVNVEDLRISVMAGPIFSDDDPTHRDVQIPREHWKLVAYRDIDSDDVFKVKAFVLTQRDLIRDLETLELEPFRLFQVSLENLHSRTGLDFGELENFDAFGAGSISQPESLSQAIEIFTRADVSR